ncbi:MAG: enoyl-CoA hydratase-related protein [Pseudomonadales bacterium]|jgi:2-(1,2-epoxy-1,2-dihydrophenyl)acetyl-CoA isomerase|nr:enoyl-CoA hydratase-related protein [Pseudomonadales bacterium]
MDFDTILVEDIDGVRVVTLHRPERMNAWTYQMGAELATAVKAGNDDDEIEAFVVTGAGRGFCAGADIGDVFDAQQQGEGRASARSSESPRDWVGLVRGSKPMVAAINGAAIGVGLTQVLPFDAILAAEGVKLSVRFIRMGLVPELASSRFLLQRVGFGAASDLMLTGRTILAEEAKEIGLVDRVVRPEGLMDAALAQARAMGSNPQQALRMVKELLTVNANEPDLARVQQRELAALQVCYTSPEHKEAIAAFLEKREPDFRAARRSAGED